MKILFLTPQLPYPPQKGTALRNWGLISGLAERHDIALLSFLDPRQPSCVEPPLERRCRTEVIHPPSRSTLDRLRTLFTAKPDMARRLDSPTYAERLADWLERETFDVVQIEGIELAPYLDVIEEAEPRPFVVFDDHNCEYLLQKRTFKTDLANPFRWPAAIYSFIQWQRLKRYEAKVCRRADHVLAVSQADAAALKKIVPQVEITVVPNGIDTSVYTPKLVNHRNPLTVFTGTMDFRPNVDAVLWYTRQVWPLIKAEEPEARFVVVGQRPHKRLEELRRDPSIRVTGHVEEVRPYIKEASVYVAPLRMGGGTRLKLLEAMAMGKPVVATRLGAEGYPITDGQELLLADSPTAFAQAVIELLRSRTLRADLGRAARSFVEANYDWQAIVPRVEAIYPK